MSLGIKANGVLEVSDLVVNYQRKPVLCQASMTVAPGEIVALLGQNGSGKTSLLKAIVGLVSCQGGTVTFDGETISGEEPHQVVRRGLGYLMQDGGVFPSFTVLEHLQFARRKVRHDDFKRRVDIVWQVFPRLQRLRNVRAGLLSGGERQMLAMSLLLVQETRVWLLDEPSCGLSPNAVRGLMETISQSSQEQGISVLLVEQNVREALRVANRVMLLKNGAIQELEHKREDAPQCFVAELLAV